ncbi:class I SAM-dependent DNA methyltransferase [Pseudonocardia acaciae]|uniref:class I SAM-dependent DNA methyltransferase n=1 Tax=Pseudonocardia acaciae TaxID=551276 RepID=UPI00048D3627|nr:class I SAM-dependent methyltransferase [Pseudonocardia acaciae]
MTTPSYLDSTKAGYDAMAADYAEHFRHELRDRPLDRATLGAFAELVRADSAGPVVEVGSGPGEVTAFLHGLGLDIAGVDLSPGMVAVARRAHPGLRFEQGVMAALDVEDGALGGLVAWYSIIHTPPERLAAVFAEFNRVLAPGGHLLLAFQVGDEPLHLDEAFGHPVDMSFHRLSPDRITGLLDRAGFAMLARTVREPSGWEKVPQAHLLARKP